ARLCTGGACTDSYREDAIRDWSTQTEPRNPERTGKPLTMAKANDNFLAAIDVGSAKTCVLVAETTDNGLRYRGHGLADSRGSRKGIIVDLENAVASMQEAAERAGDDWGVSFGPALR